MTSSTRATLVLDHLGIAVSDLPAMKKLFEILGVTVGHTEAVPEQGVVTHFLTLPPESPHLEFLEPVDPNGVIAQFLKKRGPGIHHLAFRVQKGELSDVCQKLVGAGVRLVYPEPKAGAHQMRINFIHPASAGGLLIELMEPSV
jgi:methylmalonyl-CoA/ethylmalonyl-CoA epimerase